jgi:16S rRNA processing protein RimM
MNEAPVTCEPSDRVGEELITIARIARPHGVRGEVIADLLTDFPDRFAGLEMVKAVRPDGGACTLKIERARLHHTRIILKFAGYETVERADELRKTRLMIERAQLISLPEDSYYNFDLVDCAVVTTGGQSVGIVADVQNYGSAPLLNVRGPQREHLIPLVPDICTEIDLTRKRIVIDPPAGLLDL